MSIVAHWLSSASGEQFIARAVCRRQLLKGPILTLMIAWLVVLQPAAFAAEPLPSWRDTPARQQIVSFVERVTNPENNDFVPREERIAVFDNDGTLWAEQPAYFQLLFALDQVRRLAPMHPEWKDRQPFAAALTGDMASLREGGTEALLELVMATHAGMSSDAFTDSVLAWLEEARHPRFDRRFTELTYQPMLELLTYLADSGFSNYIVSGGGVAFMRAWGPEVYGIPPERIIGSQLALAYRSNEQEPRIERQAKIVHINDKEGKPVGIYHHIGRRPIFAAGNSDGDLAMLEWTTGGDGPSFGVLIHHTDSEREWAYDRVSSVGHLDRALDLAPKRGWTVVSMATDWQQIFAFEE